MSRSTETDLPPLPAYTLSHWPVQGLCVQAWEGPFSLILIILCLLCVTPFLVSGEMWEAPRFLAALHHACESECARGPKEAEVHEGVTIRGTFKRTSAGHDAVRHACEVLDVSGAALALASEASQPNACETFRTRSGHLCKAHPKL